MSFAEDSSSFAIHANTSSEDLLIQLMVIDPMGRKGGCELSPVKTCYDEIFGNEGGYGTNRLGDEESLTQANNESLELFYGPVMPGTHTIMLESLTSTTYFYEIRAFKSDFSSTNSLLYEGYISSNTPLMFKAYVDPTPGAPAPVVTKTVTFDTLRQDLAVAQKLNQLGDDKFANSLIRMVNLGEKLAGKCDKRKKDKKCTPAIALLNMVVKRLEVANRKCDSKDPKACDEDKDWEDFGKEHRKDHDYDEFFRDWDRDGWHKDKKTCKRFVTDEALKIIKEDANWLIKSLGGEMDKGHGKDNSDRDNGRGAKVDKKDKN
jgi:hypothetical protein